MNKSIKTEFDNLINDQTPDLWDRIEASLPEKQIGVSEDNNKKSKYNFAIYGTVGAAACLCLILFATGQGRFKTGTDMTTEYTSDQTDSMEMTWETTETAGEYEESGYEETVEEYGEVNYEEAEYTDMAESNSADIAVEETATEEAVSEEMADSADTENDAGSAVSIEGERLRTADADKSVQTKIDELSKQGLTVYEDVSVQIETVSQVEIDGKTVAVYTGIVLQRTEYLEKGARFEFYGDELLDTKLEAGENYLVTFYDNKLPYDSSIHEYFILKAEK